MLFKDLDKMTLEERVIYQGELIKKLYETVPEIFGQIGYHSKVEYNSEQYTYDIADIYDIGENKLKVNDTLTFVDGSVCRIVTVGEKTFTVEYLYSAKGPKGDKGTSISGFSTISSTNSGDNTITEVQAETDAGNFPFEIYAAKGPKGDKGTSISGFSTDSYTNSGDNTITTVHAETDAGNFPFQIYAARGLKGDKGTTISGFSTIGSTNSGDNTITRVQAETDAGNFPFEIYAANGSSGGSNAGYLYINVPDTTTSGLLDEQELNILLGSRENKIILNNEIYLLQDSRREAGYLIYAHIEHKSRKEFFTKCITVTINTKVWVLTTFEQQKQLYLHRYSIDHLASDESTEFTVSFCVITNSKDPIRANSSKYVFTNNAGIVSYHGVQEKFVFYNVGHVYFNANGTINCEIMLFTSNSYKCKTLMDKTPTVTIEKV